MLPEQLLTDLVNYKSDYFCQVFSRHNSEGRAQHYKELIWESQCARRHDEADRGRVGRKQKGDLDRQFDG